MNLVPTLKRITVAPEQLILDPNNPRLMTSSSDERNMQDADVLLDKTLSIMRGSDAGDDEYHIAELEKSIISNGWLPVDSIFVRKLKEQKYLVLEGNRRVTALRNIRNIKPEELIRKYKIKSTVDFENFLKTLNSIEVMEIIDDVTEDQLREKITYLLGVRHHGSLKKWSPFARAHNIYLSYLELQGMTQENFQWNINNDAAEKISSALSIDKKTVEAQIKIYRAMEQLGNNPEIKKSEPSAGIKDHHFSLFEEALIKKGLDEYIKQDGTKFLLDDDSVQRMKNLCHFDIKDRFGSPISKPQEWRALAKILNDLDLKKKEEMLEKVEIQKIEPSKVYAERAVELQKPLWNGWLSKLKAILDLVQMGDDLRSDEAIDVTQKLNALVSELDKRDEI